MKTFLTALMLLLAATSAAAQCTTIMSILNGQVLTCSLCCSNGACIQTCF